jgi:hypothetical protein
MCTWTALVVAVELVVVVVGGVVVHMKKNDGEPPFQVNISSANISFSSRR